MVIRLLPLLGAMVLVVAVLPNSVAAHAAFVSSTPAGGSTLQAAPAQVSVVFSGPVTRAGSSITVTGPNGAAVSGATSVSGNTISAPLTAAGAGTYSVNWTNESQDDGHQESGSFSFSVAAAQPAPAQAAPAQAAPAQSAPAQTAPRPASTQPTPAAAQTAPRVTASGAAPATAAALPGTGTGLSGDEGLGMTTLVLFMLLIGGAAPVALARVRNRR